MIIPGLLRCVPACVHDFVVPSQHTGHCHNECFLLCDVVGVYFFALVYIRSSPTGLVRMPDVGFKTSFTMVLLSPIHHLQAVLVSNKCNEGDFRAIKAINECSRDLGELLFSAIDTTARGWESLHGLANFAEDGIKKVVRRELTRALGGMYARLVVDMRDDVQRFSRSVDASGRDEEMARRAFDVCLRLQECCRTRAVSNLIAALAQRQRRPDAAEDDDDELALDVGKAQSMAEAHQLAGCATIKATERDHAGNRHRANTSSNRIRSWRRQVSQYLVARSRERYLRIPGSRRKLLHISRLSWKAFFTRATLTKRMGIGGSLKREFINMRSSQNRGRYDRQTFNDMRRAWAREFDGGVGDRTTQRQIQTSFRNTQAASRARVAMGAGLGPESPEQREEDRVFQARTHWGMGCGTFPISVANFTGFCQEHRPSETSRDGLRRLARSVLPEETLLEPPTRRKLVAPRRKECSSAHPGFCVTEHAPLAASYRRVLDVIKRWEDPASAGMILLRFSVVGRMAPDEAEGSLLAHKHFFSPFIGTGHATRRATSIVLWRTAMSLWILRCRIQLSSSSQTRRSSSAWAWARERVWMRSRRTGSLF